VDFVEGKSRKFGSDTKLTRDRGRLGFVVGILWNWGRTREKRKDMITNRHPDFGFTAYDSIHRININIQSK